MGLHHRHHCECLRWQVWGLLIGSPIRRWFQLEGIHGDRFSNELQRVRRNTPDTKPRANYDLVSSSSSCSMSAYQLGFYQECVISPCAVSSTDSTQRVFSMFVLEALVLTFMTTPLVTWLYPPHTRTRISASGSKPFGVGDGESVHVRSRTGSRKTRFTVVLDKFEHLAGMMALTQLVTPSQKSSTKNDTSRPLSLAIPDSETSPTSVEALRVIELSDRVSAVMKSSAADALFRSDPLLSAFRMFGTLNQIQIDPSLAIVSFSEMARTIAEQASNYGSDMILIPWLTSGQDAFGGNPHIQSVNADTNPLSAPSTPKGPIHNPFELLFKGSTHHGSASIIHSQFVRSVFSQSTTDVALFVDQSMLDSLSDGKHHLFLPFFGGPDDRLALELVLQLCENPDVTATVVRIKTQEEPGRSLPSAGLKSPDDSTALTVASVRSLVVSIYETANPVTST
jgi:hypothetical protein